MDQHDFDFFPKLCEPSAWRGEDLQRSEDLWTYQLTRADVQELENAASKFLRSGKPLGQISSKDFVLNRLTKTLEETQKQLRDGIGFRLISGLLPIIQRSLLQLFLWNWQLYRACKITKCCRSSFGTCA